MTDTTTSTGTDTDDFDPHALAEQDFLDEVHSFQFWFDSIEGYLTDRPYGRLEATDEEPLDDDRRDRLIDDPGQLTRSARPPRCRALPGSWQRRRTATRDLHGDRGRRRGRHLEVSCTACATLGVADPESRSSAGAAGAGRSSREGALLDLVAGGDWQGVFART